MHHELQEKVVCCATINVMQPHVQKQLLHVQHHGCQQQCPDSDALPSDGWLAGCWLAQGCCCLMTLCCDGSACRGQQSCDGLMAGTTLTR